MWSNVTSAVALLLAVVSLGWQWRRTRPKLKVEPRIKVRPLPSVVGEHGTRVDKDVPTLSVHLSNPGERPVHVVTVELEPARGPSMVLPEFNILYPNYLPQFTVEPLHGHTYTVRGQVLADRLVQLGFSSGARFRVVVEDEVGRRYTSRRIPITPEQLVEDGGGVEGA